MFISTGSPIKGIVSVLLGLFLATVGIDPTAGHPRFTFGNVELMAGVSLIPTMIGMFAVSEILRWVTSSRSIQAVGVRQVGNVFSGQLALMRRYWRSTLRSAIVGTGIGALPGAGADIAAWVTYAMEKRLSKTPEKFGTGYIEGVDGPEHRQQCEPRRRLDPGTGVRHPGRLDHRHRDRRALHEGHESRAR